MEAHRINRFGLVARREAATPGRPAVRRYSLARLGPSSRSALGHDRLERLEQIASLDRPERPEAGA